jgi:hypothetical protein
MFGVMLLVVCALSAVAASGASAHEWLTLAGAKVGKTESATTVYSIRLETEKIPSLFGGGELTVLCMGEFLGTVGANGTDAIASFESLTDTEVNKLKCEVNGSTNTICKAGTPVTTEPVNLPWSTKLVLITAGFIFDDITAEKGGKFGYKVTCEGIADECTNEL